ncbi:NAD-dependent epimerase/dehydratase family protein [Mycolicibacterium fortuitum]|uniref:NAD-dependent epimerase/dehydratase family protein n=1 Tax=Mycolicibacterium fortuitum TaxID=1766 RepID=UPI00260ACC52|nr:NAD-dependent epimerase/dehydratase family protein [Mycolicibacterium fortuitum]
MTHSYLVTGGAGFIGTHIVRRLRDQHPEARIVVIDNYLSGQTRFSPAENIEVIVGDVIDPPVLDALPADIGAIYHLACPASPPTYQRNPLHTFQTAVLGTFNVLSWATQHQARVLVASTSEIYGDPLVHPQDESYWGNVNSVGVRSCYDEGKRGGETLATDFRRQYGTDVRVARIFNTYGPGMRFDDGRVVSNFAASALRGQPLTVYGDGQQTRSFCFIDDLIDGLMLLMNAENTPAIQPAVNLGNPREMTVAELVTLVVKTTGFSKICYQPLPFDDPTRRQPDITVARRALGWAPQVSIESGFVATLNDFAQRMGQPARFGVPGTAEAA